MVNLIGELFIDGLWFQGYGSFFELIQLVIGEIVWDGNSVNLEDVDVVVCEVCSVFLKWCCKSFVECLVVVEVFCDQLEENKEVLVYQIGLEIGKLFWELCIEVVVMIGKIVIFVKVYNEWMGYFEFEVVGGQVVLWYWFYGVVVVFGFYNFLGYLLNGYIVLVLLVGNIVVFKFSELIFGVVEMIVKFWEKVGIFDGVINLV